MLIRFSGRKRKPFFKVSLADSEAPMISDNISVGDNI